MSQLLKDKVAFITGSASGIDMKLQRNLPMKVQKLSFLI